MHRALLIAEVQREVLSWVDEAKSALALALTARAFLEAGLDFTWRHGTVYDLALTMPPKYRSAVLIQKGIMITLSQTERPQTWMGPRFLLYAHSLRTISVRAAPQVVRMLYSGDNGSEPCADDEGSTLLHRLVHPEIISTWLDNQDQSQPVFAKLRSVTFLWNAELTSLVLTLAHKELLSFRFECLQHAEDQRPPFPAEAEEFMLQLCLKSPNLTTFYAQLGSGELRIHGTSAITTSWRQITDLHLCYRVSDESLLPLSHLACLRHLKVSNLGAFLDIQGSLPSNAFPKLVTVCITNVGLKPSAYIIQSITSSLLVSVTVNPPGRMHRRGPDSYIPFVQALSKHSALEVIYVGQSGRTLAQARRTPDHNLADFINPLIQSLPKLRKLDLMVGQSWFGGEGVILSIAETWPNLEILAINAPGHCVSVPLSCFATILQLCSKLQVFGVAVDISSPVPAPEAFPQKANHHLEHLRMRLSLQAKLPSSKQQQTIAAFLKAACPSVRLAPDWAMRGQPRDFRQWVNQLQNLVET